MGLLVVDYILQHFIMNFFYPLSPIHYSYISVLMALLEFYHNASLFYLLQDKYSCWRIGIVGRESVYVVGYLRG